MLTLKKVKELVEAPSHAKRTPSPKMLFEEGIVLLRREFDQGSHLTVYNSGYVLFSAGKRNTVFHIHDCQGDYTWMFFKYFVKMWIAVYLVSHTFDITMAVFDIGQSVVNSSSSIIRGNTAIDISSLSMQMQAAMATMAIGELVTLALETLVVSWCLKILSVVITVIMYGRMIEIYLYTSLAPIPFATMSNREWGHVGTNYFRGLFALAFQAFLMMVCVAIYAALIGSIRVSSDIHSALFGTMAYTVILCFSLLKTGSLSKQIFGSH